MTAAAAAGEALTIFPTDQQHHLQQKFTKRFVDGCSRWCYNSPAGCESVKKFANRASIELAWREWGCVAELMTPAWNLKHVAVC